MYRSSKLIIVSLFVYINVNFNVLCIDSSDVEEAFKADEVVPDLILVAPTGYLTVKYDSGAVVMLGNEISPLKVATEPSVSWDADPDSYYTLAMLDPDVPSRALPLLGPLRHWLVGNIPGKNVKAGQVLSTYLSPTPPVATGLHRYVFLVYEQPGVVKFDENALIGSVARTNFSIEDFAEEYDLGDPQFGNFFKSQFVVDVPILDPLLGS